MVCTHPDLLARICKLVERKKFGLICFPRICFPRLIYCDQEPLLLLNVTEDYFLGVHIRLYQLDTRFVLLQNHLPFPSKCALKLTDLWNTKLLFDLSYKFINVSFAFSCRNRNWDSPDLMQFWFDLIFFFFFFLNNSIQKHI